MKLKLFSVLIAVSYAIQLDQNKPCEPALEMSNKEMAKQMDLFSRTFDEKYYKNAIKIYEANKGKPGAKVPQVTTWELYDKAFTWKNVRKYEMTKEQLSEIEKWQENLNTNITNSRHLEEFIHHARIAQKKLAEKYNTGEFIDPATKI